MLVDTETSVLRGRWSLTTVWRCVGLLIAVAGLAARAWLVRSPLGGFDSDEATTAFMGRDVAHGKFAGIVAGNNYGGTLEAYVYAPFHWILGNNLFVAKAIPTALWAVASWCLFVILRQLTERTWAIGAGLAMWVGGPWMAYLNTRFFLGYGTGLVCLFLFAMFVVRAAGFADGEGHRSVSRVLFFAGVAGGAAVWQHPLALATVFPASIGVAYELFRRGKSQSILDIGRYLAGLVVGVFPFLWFNIRTSFSSRTAPSQPPMAYLDRFRGVVAQLVPRSLGLRGLDGGWIFGPVSVVLFVVLAVSCLVGAYKLWATQRAVVLAALFGLPILAAFPALRVVNDGRYFIFAMPAIMVCLFVGAHALSAKRSRHVAVVFSYSAVLLVATYVSLLHSLPHHFVDPNADIKSAIHEINARGFHHVQADYWFAYRATFLSDGTVVASSLGPNRFPDIDSVALPTDPSVFSSTDPGDAARRADPRLEAVVVGEFTIFFPKVVA